VTSRFPSTIHLKTAGVVDLNFGEASVYLYTDAQLLPGSVVVGGDGSSYINLSGSEKVSGINVILGMGDNLVKLEGNSNVIVVGEGRNNVTLAGASNLIATGSGNNNVNFRGDYGTVLTGSGADQVSFGGHLSVLDTGDGDDRVRVEGTGLRVTTGDGNDRLMVGYSDMLDRNSIDAGAGDDTFNLASGNNIVTGGKGNDTFYMSCPMEGAAGSPSLQTIFVLNRAGDGTDQIFGNVIRDGHMLDIRDALSATTWDGSVEHLSDFVGIRSLGGKAVVSITPTGIPGDPAFDVAVIHQGGAVYSAMLGHLIWM